MNRPETSLLPWSAGRSDDEAVDGGVTGAGGPSCAISAAMAPLKPSASAPGGWDAVAPVAGGGGFGVRDMGRSSQHGALWKR